MFLQEIYQIKEAFELGYNEHSCLLYRKIPDLTKLSKLVQDITSLLLLTTIVVQRRKFAWSNKMIVCLEYYTIPFGLTSGALPAERACCLRNCSMKLPSFLNVLLDDEGFVVLWTGGFSVEAAVAVVAGIGVLLFWLTLTLLQKWRGMTSTINLSSGWQCTL